MLAIILVTLIGLAILVVWNLYGHLRRRMVIAKLHQKIQNGIIAGRPDGQGAYLYEEKGYHIRYRILGSDSNAQPMAQGRKRPIEIEWTLIKYRLNPAEKAVKTIKTIFVSLFHNEDWIYLLRPPVIVLLLFILVIFYFGLVESEKGRIERLRWFYARILGLDANQIRYTGGSSIDILGQRTTAVDAAEEPISYTVRLWRWLLFGDIGYITRKRGSPYGDDVNQLSSDKAGNIWLKKEGQWQRAKVKEGAVQWEQPQGTGIRAGKIKGHEISREDKRLHILDKQPKEKE